MGTITTTMLKTTRTITTPETPTITTLKTPIITTLKTKTPRTRIKSRPQWGALPVPKQLPVHKQQPNSFPFRLQRLDLKQESRCHTPVVTNSSGTAAEKTASSPWEKKQHGTQPSLAFTCTSEKQTRGRPGHTRFLKSCASIRALPSISCPTVSTDLKPSANLFKANWERNAWQLHVR